MKSKFKKIILSLLLAGLPLHAALAEYYIYFMNNTSHLINIKNTCNNIGSSCAAFNTGKLPAFKRHSILRVNYDEGIKVGHDYTVKSYFTTPSGAQNNYFSIIVHGDTIGSHIRSVNVFINGEDYSLLNSNNSDDKVLPKILGKHSFIDNNGKKYTLYAMAQNDHPSTPQGIDSIYLAIDKKPTIFKSNGSNKLSLITYNIQDFPAYMSVALDLNKPKARMRYIGHHKNIRNADVIVFEEAWDRGARNVLKEYFTDTHPYFIDPEPSNTHSKPLNSGLLVFSKYPFTKTSFLNYQDYQSLVDADSLSNKGAIYFRINKNGSYYNFIATHTQAQDDANAIRVREQEFSLIKEKIINSPKLNIAKTEPLILIGDLNTDYYNQKQFPYLMNTLNLNTDNMANSIYAAPKYSNDSSLNLMIEPGVHEQGMYDYIVPLLGFTQPVEIKKQITPIRALDDAEMYEISLGAKLYNYGNVEISDHFMVQALFKYKK